MNQITNCQLYLSQRDLIIWAKEAFCLIHNKADKFMNSLMLYNSDTFPRDCYYSQNRQQYKYSPNDFENGREYTACHIEYQIEDKTQINCNSTKSYQTECLLGQKLLLFKNFLYAIDKRILRLYKLLIFVVSQCKYTQIHQYDYNQNNQGPVHIYYKKIIAIQRMRILQNPNLFQYKILIQKPARKMIQILLKSQENQISVGIFQSSIYIKILDQYLRLKCNFPEIHLHISIIIYFCSFLGSRYFTCPLIKSFYTNAFITLLLFKKEEIYSLNTSTKINLFNLLFRRMDNLSVDKVLKYINQARTDPKSLIPHLQKVLTKFDGQMKYQISPHFFMRTHEGKSVWKETIKYLQKQQPLHQFSMHKGLEKSAQYHATDLGNNNMMGHVGSNGSTMSQRVEMFSIHNNGSIGENVAQEIKSGDRNRELQSVLSLIVDDGVSNRGHRESIFSKHFRYIGVGFGQTNQHFLVVINFADDDLQLRDGKTPTIQQKPKNKKIQMLEFDDLTNLMNVKMKIKETGKEQKSGKTVVGKNTSTTTKINNGHKHMTKTVHIKYSDGSEETQIEEIQT